MEKNSQILNSAIFGTLVAILFITLITIAADLFIPIKDWLASVFSHHWLGKSILSLIVFGTVLMLAYFLPLKNIVRLLRWLFWISLLGTLAIFGFFLLETYFK